jgi:hypothetical protein
LVFLNRIKLSDIDHAAARGLTSTKKDGPPAVEPYYPPGESGVKKISDQPSFNFGWNSGDSTVGASAEPKAESPLRVLRDPILLTL